MTDLRYPLTTIDRHAKEQRQEQANSDLAEWVRNGQFLLNRPRVVATSPSAPTGPRGPGQAPPKPAAKPGPAPYYSQPKPVAPPKWAPAPIPQKKEANQMRKPINDLNSGRRAAAFQAAAQLPTASQREKATIAAIQRYPVIAAGVNQKTDPETLKRMDAAFGTGARLPAITHTATRSTYRASGAV